MRFVLDASVALCWCFENQATPATDAILERLAGADEAVVPVIWPLEISNVLVTAERRRFFTAAQTAGFMERLRDLPIDIDFLKLSDCLDRIVPVARDRGLSSYDASYLDLAMREGLPLATADRDLRRAARAVGVVLLDEH